MTTNTMHLLQQIQLPENFELGENCYIALQNGNYLRVGVTINRRTTWLGMLHRLVWEQLVGPIPAGHVVHHRDSDPLNNSLENLQCMTRAEHNRLHRQHPELRSAACAEHYSTHKSTYSKASKAYRTRKKIRRAEFTMLQAMFPDSDLSHLAA